jgi:hypothetical protein
MLPPHNPTIPFPKRGRNSKAGLSICLNQEDKDPFEVTVFFKNPKEDNNENAISITASGKLTLNIGKRGYLELFGENTRVIHSDEEKEGPSEMPAV